jgi:hypothetical protein
VRVKESYDSGEEAIGLEARLEAAPYQSVFITLAKMRFWIEFSQAVPTLRKTNEGRAALPMASAAGGYGDDSGAA